MSEYDQFEKKGSDDKLNIIFKKLLMLERKQGETRVSLKTLENLFSYETFSTTSTETEDPSVERVEEIPGVDVGPPIKNDLIKIGIDFELVDYEDGGLTIRPKKFLGELWGNPNKLLMSEGYKWVRDGRNSHWSFQPMEEKPVESVPSRPKGGAVIPVFEVGKYVTIEGTLIDDPTQTDRDTDYGTSSVSNVRLELSDGQTVRVGLWEKKSDKIMEFIKGDRVHLTNMKVKKPYEDTTQLSGSRNTKVSKVPSR